MSIRTSKRSILDLMKAILFFIAIVILGLLAMLLSTFAVVGPMNVSLGDLRNVKVGEPAPDFTLSDTEGNPIHLGALQGKVVILVFWRPEQERCVEALEALQAIHRQFEGEGVVVLGLSAASPEQIRQMKREHQLSFPMLHDEGRQVYGTYGVIVTPSTLLIDRQGQVAYYYPGYRRDFTSQITGHLEVALGRKTLEQLESEWHPQAKPQLSETEKQAQRYLNAGNRLLERGMARSAIRQFEKAVKANPNLVEAYMKLGDLYLRQGQPDDALGAFQRVIALKPRSAEAYAGLADAYFSKEDLERAERNLQLALKWNPYLARAHYRLGRIFEERQQLSKALDEYKMALKILLNLED